METCEAISNEQMAPIGEVLQETYRLERLIGEGGMGKVFEASHTRLRRRFAVKLLAPAVSSLPEAVARFRREGEITSSLGHPHIIEVVDSNTTPDGQSYIVMELLDGESLGSRLARPPALGLPEAAEVVRQAASALDAAHGLGVVHRDLKPENIFLCRRAGEPGLFVKVLDFGISKVLGSQSMLTAASVIMGTPSYMAPEQAEGRISEIDARTDVFALGAILYEMLAGRPPFVGESITSVLYQTVHQEPTPLRELRPLLPAAVEAVVARALAKRPEDRPPTIAALAEDLSRALLARPVAATLRSAPTSRRAAGRLARIGIALGVVALVGFGTIALWPSPPVRPASPPAGPPASHPATSPGPSATRPAASAGPSAARLATSAGPSATRGTTPDPEVAGPSSRPAAPVAPSAETETETAGSMPPARPRARRAGSLRVIALSERSATWADVYLDQRRRGQTPLLLARVAAGPHLIELRRAGYRVARKQVEVAPGSTATLRFELQRQR
jgi:serine/threonine-protein kinase